MNADDFHPFWKGVFHEFGEKKAYVGELAGQAGQLATSSPEAAAGVAGTGLLAGIGAVALKRKLFKGKGGAPKPKKTKAPAADATPDAPPAPAGFSGRALLGTGAAAGLVGYHYGGKKGQ